MPSGELADRLLQDAGVACLAGTCFGAHGEGHLRFSFANGVDEIRTAPDRIRGVLAAGAA